MDGPTTAFCLTALAAIVAATMLTVIRRARPTAIVTGVSLLATAGALAALGSTAIAVLLALVALATGVALDSVSRGSSPERSGAGRIAIAVTTAAVLAVVLAVALDGAAGSAVVASTGAVAVGGGSTPVFVVASATVLVLPILVLLVRRERS